jgi:2-methylisocitrate lyase-like PEP mutase family enzyme
MSSFEKFRTLHDANELFLLPNAWDARSAMLFEQNGYKSVGTSSAAVANSLGYEDGEIMPFTEYLFVVRRILSAIKLPFTVDIETGYGSTNEAVASNIIKLAELGVSGINIEDSALHHGTRQLKDPVQFAALISYVKEKLAQNQLELFINIRTDAYILNVPNKEEETLRRLLIYNEVGAGGIFVPCIVKENDIAEVVKNSRLPVNVMAIPGIPTLSILNKLGVRRVSMGPFMFHKVYGQIAALTKAIHAQNDLVPILD